MLVNSDRQLGFQRSQNWVPDLKGDFGSFCDELCAIDERLGRKLRNEDVRIGNKKEKQAMKKYVGWRVEKCRLMLGRRMVCN